jgi:hypothetical protein
MSKQSRVLLALVAVAAVGLVVFAVARSEKMKPKAVDRAAAEDDHKAGAASSRWTTRRTAGNDQPAGTAPVYGAARAGDDGGPGDRKGSSGDPQPTATVPSKNKTAPAKPDPKLIEARKQARKARRNMLTQALSAARERQTTLHRLLPRLRKNTSVSAEQLRQIERQIEQARAAEQRISEQLRKEGE